MLFSLITLTGLKFREDVYEVLLPTPDGEMAVLPHHMPLVTLVSPGEVKVRWRQQDSDEKMDSFAVSGGIAEITGKDLRLLSDEADKPEDIVVEEARTALKKAQDLKTQAKNQIELDQAQQLIDRNQVRIKLAEVRHHRRKV
jgi:F-type H+-transporting ATPase subunit epsilon